MTREQVIEIIMKMDPVKSKDLYRWLKYVGWNEDKFDYVADTFRDPRVWWIKDGKWWKENVDGSSTSYGKVFLSNEEQSKYKILN